MLDIDDNYFKVEEKMEKGFLVINCNGWEDFFIEIFLEFEGSLMIEGLDNLKDDLCLGYFFFLIFNVCCFWDYNCFNEVLILCDIIFNVCVGELLVIIGFVGSGKFLMLLVILGELFIYGGIIIYYGKVVFVF